MSRILGFTLAVTVFLCGEPFLATQSLAESADTAMVIYVAPYSDDDNLGDVDSLLATIGGARDRIRAIKASYGLPAGGITVRFREGYYYLTDMVYFDDEDSGLEGSPIVYEAYPGETPVFTGGVYKIGSQADKASGGQAERIPAEALDKTYAKKAKLTLAIHL